MIVAPLDFRLCACEARCQCATPNVPYESYAPSYQKILDCLRPKVVREWGPGRNTAMALDAGAEVYSTESEACYLHAHHPRLVQCYVAVENKSYPDAWVVADVFFVDGRRRADCIAKVRADAPQLHVVVLHDAKRRRYWEALGQYAFVRVAEDSTAFATDDAQLFDWLKGPLHRGGAAREVVNWQQIPVAEKRSNHG